MNQYLEPFHQLCDEAADDPESMKKLLAFKKCSLGIFGLMSEGEVDVPYILIDEPLPPKGFEKSHLIKEIELLGNLECEAFVLDGKLEISCPKDFVDRELEGCKRDVKLDSRPRIFGRDLFGTAYRVEQKFMNAFAVRSKKPLTIDQSKVFLKREELDSFVLRIYLNERYFEEECEDLKLLRQFETAKKTIKHLMHVTKYRFKQIDLSTK